MWVFVLVLCYTINSFQCQHEEVSLANVNSQIKTSQLVCADAKADYRLPAIWPCQWNDGLIPYVYNFYSSNPRRLISLVRKGIQFLEDRSCLKFLERNPIQMAQITNYTYLFFTYSGVLEKCCLMFFTKPYGRRLILITPVCSLPAEVAHATLHALGLRHAKMEPFNEEVVRNVLFNERFKCENLTKKQAEFHNKQDLPLWKLSKVEEGTLTLLPDIQ